MAAVNYLKCIIEHGLPDTFLTNTFLVSNLTFKFSMKFIGNSSMLVYFTTDSKILDAELNIFFRYTAGTP